jgi:UDP-N-acetylmuramoylalanine--D-glutamate ligase
MDLVLPTSLSAVRTAPVAILGGGVSGQGVQQLVTALGGAAVVYDAAGTAFTAEKAAQHRLLVFSPGFAPGHPWLALARKAGLDCWTELDFAAQFWRGRLIAITGTNGKTTLTEFLVHALTTAGQEAHATGNIGRSFAQLVTDLNGGQDRAVAVCEVSSFQAEPLRSFRPDVTLWTNFAEDHLERHGSLAGYFAAKAVLVHRSAAAWAGPSVRTYAAQEGFAAPDSLHWVDDSAEGDPGLEGTVFAEPPQRENFRLAAAWWAGAGLRRDQLYEAARTFRLGRHRLGLAGVVQEVGYWNDSKATNFHAVEAALSRFAAPVWLIAGGKSKGGDLPGFVRRIAPRVKELFLIGDTAEALADAAAAAGVACQLCPQLKDAVQAAARAARPGDQVLLSPGFASFDQFRNYQDRGDQFEALVRELASAVPLSS